MSKGQISMVTTKSINLSNASMSEYVPRKTPDRLHLMNDTGVALAVQLLSRFVGGQSRNIECLLAWSGPYSSI